MVKRIGRTRAFLGPEGAVMDGSIAEAVTMRLGGLDQWVLIRGRNRDNPLLVILHGGPGSPETGFLRAYNAELEDAFTVVYWDQRGAGRSYAPTIPPASMTLEQVIADLDQLISSLLTRFSASKVALLGHSFGTLLGINYAHRYPDKVSVYVAVSQIANMAASEAAGLAFAIDQAERRHNTRALRQLRRLGPMPLDMRATGVQRRWLTAFGGVLGPGHSVVRMIWRSLTAPDSSILDLVRLARGSPFSLRTLWPDLSSANPMQDIVTLATPVFFCVGRHDRVVAAELSARYFELIKAPLKQLIWFEESGHMAPFEEPARFNALMVEEVRQLAMRSAD
jgi:pimeloyl-ACP methyl ester carboxylesterase